MLSSDPAKSLLSILQTNEAAILMMKMGVGMGMGWSQPWLDYYCGFPRKQVHWGYLHIAPPPP